jgi:hypothetical protein
METPFASIQDFLKAWSRNAGDRSIGISPGGAAAVLGVSRGMVHKLMRQGRLDWTSIGGGPQAIILIDEESLQRYRDEVKARKGWGVHDRARAS